MFSTISRKGKSWNIHVRQINQSKGLIYIHDYNIPDIDDSVSELKKEYHLVHVQRSAWIKTKNTTSTPLLLTFKEK